MKKLGFLSALIAVLALLMALGGMQLDHHPQLLDYLLDTSLLASLYQPMKSRFVSRVADCSDCSCGEVAQAVEEGAACQLSGTITDSCCSYAAVERVNRDELSPILDHLVKTPFFRYFKVDLYCDCPFWPEDGMCSLRDCSVCECEQEEIPKPWREAEAVDSCESTAKESVVDRTLQPQMKARLLSVRDWRGFKNPWMPEVTDDEKVDYSYINLLRNGERYTGYKGEHANRIWGSIYEQSCFRNIDHPDTCAEKRIFYKLISGMHSSITAHIVGDYLIDEATNTWGPNIEMFKARLGNPWVRNRVENLYFTYLFVLRAAMKAGPLLASADYSTGSPEEDARTSKLVRRLIENDVLQKACPIPFDEGRLWKGEDGAELKEQLQKAFHNITYIMDCVGCEKCKMWGKLQLLGIATSLKILFSSDNCSGGHHEEGLILERNEVIALINFLERLAKAVDIVRSLSLQVVNGEAANHPQGLGAIQDVTHQSLPGQLRSQTK